MSLPLKVNATATLATSTTSASVAIPPGATLLRIAGSASSFIKTGNGAQTATTSDLYVPLQEALLLVVPANHDTLAAILASGTGTLSIAAVSLEEP